MARRASSAPRVWQDPSVSPGQSDVNSSNRVWPDSGSYDGWEVPASRPGCCVMPFRSSMAQHCSVFPPPPPGLSVARFASRSEYTRVPSSCVFLSGMLLARDAIPLLEILGRSLYPPQGRQLAPGNLARAVARLAQGCRLAPSRRRRRRARRTWTTSRRARISAVCARRFWGRRCAAMWACIDVRGCVGTG